MYEMRFPRSTNLEGSVNNAGRPVGHWAADGNGCRDLHTQGHCPVTEKQSSSKFFTRCSPEWRE